jgi:hypothetical protein
MIVADIKPVNVYGDKRVAVPETSIMMRLLKRLWCAQEVLAGSNYLTMMKRFV